MTDKATPREVGLSDGLGAWWRKLTHRHEYKQRKNWGILGGQLVCMRTTYCEACGKKFDQALLLIATAEELAEAASKRVESNQAHNDSLSRPQRPA